MKDGKALNKIQKKITDYDKKHITQVLEKTIFEGVINILNNTNEKLETIGIAVPGTVKVKTVDELNQESAEAISLSSEETVQIINKCVNLGIKDYNIVQALNNKFIKYANEEAKQYQFEKLPITIKLQNDAKCAAIAESKYGVLADYKSAIFLTLGTGIGGAVIDNGELLEGKCFSGYEFGHMTININGEQCNCGKNGCFELYGSMKNFKTKLKESLGLSQLTHGEQLAELLKYDKAFARNDERIKRVIEEYTQNLAIGISNLINIFEPEAVCIGGSFTYFEEFLLEELKQKILNGNLLFNPRSDIILKSAILKNDAGIIGASML